MAKETKAVKYVECSAMTQIGKAILTNIAKKFKTKILITVISFKYLKHHCLQISVE